MKIYSNIPIMNNKMQNNKNTINIKCISINFTYHKIIKQYYKNNIIKQYK